MAGSTLLFSEILDRVHKAKTKDQKVKILRDNNTPSLRSVLKASFDPNIKSESRKLWHFIKGGDGQTPQWKKEQMFVQLLEGLHETEAELLVNAKDKKLHQIYKGLSTNVVCEAFNWNDNFMLMS